MVNAVGGGPQAAPVKKPEEKKEEKKPESQAPAPSPAPAERPNAGNTGSTDVNAPKDGLDPKAAFAVSQRLNTKSTGETKPKKANAPEDSASQEDAARELLNGTEPAGKGKAPENGEGENGMGQGEPDPTKRTGDDNKPKEKPEKEKPPEKPMTKDSALAYAYANYGIFDTGAGIDGADNKFSIKDLNALKDSKVKEVADNAKKLINEDIIGELGGKDGKISREDIEGYFEDNFDITKEYKNIDFQTDGFSDDEIKTLNKQFAFLANDPDGQILLHNMNTKPGGMTIKKNKEDPDGGGASTSGNTEDGTTVKFKKVRDEGSFLSVMTHEFTHAASTQNGKSNDEALSSVLGHRIWSRYEGGAEHEFTNDKGEEVKFDGSKEAEEMVFIEELKKRGDGKPESYDAGHGDYLRSLGFEFDFDTNVSEFDGDKPVYSDPVEEPDEPEAPTVNPGAGTGGEQDDLEDAIEDAFDGTLG